jgi:uncharacterized protein
MNALTSFAPAEKRFREFLADGQFMLQKGRESGAFTFYPRVFEPGTGGEDVEWVKASGRGTVYSVTVVRPRPPQVPFNVALVDLQEGVRLMSRIEGVDAEDVKIGMSVQAAIVEQDGEPIIIFVAEQEAANGL